MFNINYYDDYFCSRICLRGLYYKSAVKFLIILRREKEPQICGSLLF